MKKEKKQVPAGACFFEEDMPDRRPGRVHFHSILWPLTIGSHKKPPRALRGVVFCFMVLLQRGCVQSIRGDGYAFLWAAIAWSSGRNSSTSLASALAPLDRAL